jgi:hypothetical protein
VRLSRLEKATVAAREARARQGQLDTFRRRLQDLEASMKLKVPPADLIQLAEILLDSARTDGERAEGRNILRECQGRVARHLLQTANELLATGEREVAVGLLRRAQSLDSDVGDEIKLRLASIRRDELEKEISKSVEVGAFAEARIKIARLRSIHPIFEPVAMRLETEVDTTEAGKLLDQVVSVCSAADRDPQCVLEAKRLLERARSLHPDDRVLAPIEAHLQKLATGVPKAGGETVGDETVDDEETGRAGNSDAATRMERAGEK